MFGEVMLHGADAIASRQVCFSQSRIPTEILQTMLGLGNSSMVVEMVPLKGGIGSIFHPQTKARTISGI